MRFNPISAASKSVIQEMTAIEREVAMKIPAKEAAREVGRRLQADLDAALQVAVERYLGHPITDPTILVGRLTHVSRQGKEGTTYHVDGVPVLWAGLASIVREADTVRGERQLRQIDGESAP